MERNGGDYGTGLIRGVAIITRGEALGHGLWIDATMLGQVATAIHAAARGIKARFTHPGLSADGLGKFLGRFKDAWLDGETVRADLHITPSAHRAPGGNLAEYVMQLAETDPAAFGSSIVFERDLEAEDEHITSNGGKVKRDEDGWRSVDLRKYKSPDSDNAKNLPHSRLKRLRAADAVDSPAANPNGLFHRGQEVADEAERVISYALGLSDERPTTSEFDIDPDRVAGFVQRFLDRHGLSIVTKEEASMPPEDGKPVEESPASQASEPQQGSEPGDVSSESETHDEAIEEVSTEAGEQESQSAETAELTNGQKFLQAFGTQGGVWFAEGRSFDEAQVLYVAKLKSENEALTKERDELKQQLTASRGEREPVTFQPEQSQKQKAVAAKTQNLGSNLAKFAAGIEFAGK